MTPQAFLAALRARLGLFIAVLAATVAVAMTVSLLLPKSYRATASLVVDTGDAQTLTNPMSALFRPQESMAYIQTQVDIITSPKVAHKVVADLRLADDPEVQRTFREKQDGKGSIVVWLANGLLNDLEVETSQSHVIDVSFVADNPDYAAQYANAFARAYIDTMLELRVEPTRNAADWFDQQLRRLRADLEEAQAKLTGYQRQYGIVSTDDQFDLDHVRLADMNERLVRLQDEKADMRERAQQARQILAGGGTLYAPSDFEADGQVQRLRAELREGEAALKVLATQYGERHPNYQRQAEANRVHRQELQRELESELAEQRARILAARESRDELAVLMRNVATAQQVYDTVMQRFVVSQVESRASRTNVTLLSAAVPPRRAWRPDLPLNFALALAIGTLFGFVLVAMNEMADRRVRSALDLDLLLDRSRGLRVPLLGSIGAWAPDRRLPGDSGHRALPAPG